MFVPTPCRQPARSTDERNATLDRALAHPPPKAFGTANFHRREMTLDAHLADQLVLPLALAGCPAAFSTEQLSKHTLTNLWVVEQFLGPAATVSRSA